MRAFRSAPPKPLEAFMRHRVFSILILAPLAACATATTPAAGPGPDRIMAVDRDGTVIRQSTADEHSRATFNAPFAKVWNSLMVSYAELGIEPTLIDRPGGRYGNGGFVFPRRFLGRSIVEVFRCGSGLTGPVVERGRVIADVLTTLTPINDSTTIATTHVAGRVHSNEGTSTDPIFCPSSGIVEQELQAAITRNLAVVR